MPSQDLVSFIVPFYNAEQYISKCVDCILKQTYPYWELLLIDDGSKDQSASISDQCATIDNRIRVIHQENKGVSVARNIGLAQANGKWIAFLDVDDIIEPQYLEHLLIKTDQPLIVGGFKRFGDLEDESLPSKSGVCIIKDELQEMWERSLKGFIFWYVWGKLFRKDIIDQYNIHFIEGMMYNEDNCFVLNYLSKISSFEFVQHTDYLHYFEHRGKSKYIMSFDQYDFHRTHQEESFLLLENANQHHYTRVRRSINRRYFIRFACFLFTRDSFITYKRNITPFIKKYGNQLDSICYWGNVQKVKKIAFKYPAIIGYAIRTRLLEKTLQV